MILFLKGILKMKNYIYKCNKYRQNVLSNFLNFSKFLISLKSLFYLGLKLRKFQLFGENLTNSEKFLSVDTKKNFPRVIFPYIV